MRILLVTINKVFCESLYKINDNIIFSPLMDIYTAMSKFLIKKFFRESGLLLLRKSGRLKNAKSHNNKDCQHFFKLLHKER